MLSLRTFSATRAAWLFRCATSLARLAMLMHSTMTGMRIARNAMAASTSASVKAERKVTAAFARMPVIRHSLLLWRCNLILIVVARFRDRDRRPCRIHNSHGGRTAFRNCAVRQEGYLWQSLSLRIA